MSKNKNAQLAARKQKPKNNTKNQPHHNARRNKYPVAPAYQPRYPPRFTQAVTDVGTAVGNKIGNFLGGIFGMGAYKIRQNTVMDAISQQVPFMHSSSETVVLRHREYISDVSSSTSFTTNVFAVNPGLAATFPFLSAIAQNFQEYQFRGLVFEFKSLSADALNSTNTALGSVALAVQYRADAPRFYDKQQLLNEMWSVDNKPSCDTLLPVECDPLENPLKIQYVRGGPVPSGQDTKLYDLAQLTVATYGSQAAAVVGELWATYEVVLRKPQLNSGVGLYLQSAHYVSYNGYSDGSPLAGLRSNYDSIGLTTSATSITFPTGSQGIYLVAIQWETVATAVNVVPPTLGVSPSTSSIAPVTMADGSFKLTGPPTAISSKSLVLVYFVRISDTASQTILTMTGGTLPDVTGDWYSDLFVTQCASGLV